MDQRVKNNRETNIGPLISVPYGPKFGEGEIQFFENGNYTRLQVFNRARLRNTTKKYTPTIQLKYLIVKIPKKKST